MINLGYFKPSFRQIVENCFFPNAIMRYLVVMRKFSYYCYRDGAFNKIVSFYYRIMLRKLGMRLGFSIGPNVFGYALRIPHFGTIVVGDHNEIGNYAVLHTSTCITSNNKQIGNGLALCTGAKITSCTKLGDAVTIAANSVVTKDFNQSNLLLVGMPANIKRSSRPWYLLSNEYEQRFNQIEELKKQMAI